MEASLHADLRRCIPIIDGDADIWALFNDAPLYRRVLRAMADPYRGKVTKVVGAESRGFVIGQALACELQVGFVGIRKQLGFLPGSVHSVTAGRDYRGNANVFRLQQHALSPDDVVVLADDWMETGNSALAVKQLVEDGADAYFYGATTVVDQLSAERKAQLGIFTGIIPNTVLFADEEQKVYSEMDEQELREAARAFGAPRVLPAPLATQIEATLRTAPGTGRSTVGWAPSQEI